MSNPSLVPNLIRLLTTQVLRFSRRPGRALVHILVLYIALIIVTITECPRCFEGCGLVNYTVLRD